MSDLANETVHLEEYLDPNRLLNPHDVDLIKAKKMTPIGWVKSMFSNTFPKTGGTAAEAALGKFVDTAVNAGKWVPLEITDTPKPTTGESPGELWQAVMTHVNTETAGFLVDQGLAKRNLAPEGLLGLMPTPKGLDLIHDKVNAYLWKAAR